VAQRRQRCCLCDLDLEEGKVAFSYMGKIFNQEVPRCPSCGQVYISEEMVRSKIAEVEQIMEEK
jgi:hypothetical protein